MSGAATVDRWSALLAGGRAMPLAVLLGGVLLYATNALLASTILPSVVAEIGGVAIMSWPTVAFLAASILASTLAALLAARLGARNAYVAGLLIFGLGALVGGTASSMAQMVAGRFVQGFGGGLISALAYVMIRNVFPQVLWPRVFALMSGTWGVAVLAGPLIGGVFAGFDLWRGAFLTVAALAGLLVPFCYGVLPRELADRDLERLAFPAGRLTLVGLGITAVTIASVMASAGGKIAFILLMLTAFALFIRLDRTAATPLLPSDAFRSSSRVGVGLSMILLLAVANDPFPIFGPLLLQQLHGFDPLSAGYLVAGEAMAWTLVAAVVASLPARWSGVFLVVGPLVMGVALLGIALALPEGPVVALFAAIVLAGSGIGACWSFISHQVMTAARPGEGNAAAAAIASVQMTGLALGGALAGLVANMAGFSAGLDITAARQAAFWVPAFCVLPALLAGLSGARLALLSRRSS